MAQWGYFQGLVGNFILLTPGNPSSGLGLTYVTSVESVCVVGPQLRVGRGLLSSPLPVLPSPHHLGVIEGGQRAREARPTSPPSAARVSLSALLRPPPPPPAEKGRPRREEEEEEAAAACRPRESIHPGLPFFSDRDTSQRPEMITVSWLTAAQQRRPRLLRVRRVRRGGQTRSP